MHLLIALIKQIVDALSFLPQSPWQVLRLAELALRVLDLTPHFLVLIDQVFELMLCLVKRSLKNCNFIHLVPQTIS